MCTVLRRYKAGYEIREEAFLTGDGVKHQMKSAYTSEGNYIGNSKDAYRLCKKRGIKPELASPDNRVCSIGFCEKEQKWYGWSHRAICGFGIGSTCQKGDCHYVPASFKEMQKECWSFKEGQCTVNCSAERREPSPEEITTGLHEKFLVEETRGLSPKCCEENCVFKLGRGEWAAKTLEDAKLMAIDFAEGVS